MKRKLVAFVVILALVGLLWLLLRRHLTLETLAAHETRLRRLIVAHPLAGFALAYLIYTAVSLVPGTTGKALVSGWLFGLWRGTLLVNFALTTAAVMTFLLSRHLLREAVQSKLGFYVNRLDQAIERDGPFYLFALRMMHAPYTVTNYACGTTSMATGSFWRATQLGMLPGNIVFVYAGAQLPTLRQAAEEGVGGVFSMRLMLAFVLVGLFPLAARWTIRRLWRRGRNVAS